MLRKVYDNQVELSKELTRLDTQQAVLTRLVIMNLNEILIRLGSDELVTYEGVNQMFHDFAALKTRPDHRDHMKDWFMGVDLSTLPPLEENEPEETQEGPKEFGGDYAEGSDSESVEEEQSEGKETGEADALPQGQEIDDPSSPGSTVPLM